MTELGLQNCLQINNFHLAEYSVSEVILMIESFGLGILLSLAFIGFISLIYFIVLCYLRFEFTGRFVIHITNEMSKPDIYYQMYGVDIRKLIYGDGIFKEVIVIDSLTDADKKIFLNEICDDLCGFTLINDNDIQSYFDNKGV